MGLIGETPDTPQLLSRKILTRRCMDKEIATEYRPEVVPEMQLCEGTARAVITGTILGMIFGASSLYLALKVGLTVSASIPVAVISITIYRLWAKMGGRDATILEH